MSLMALQLVASVERDAQVKDAAQYSHSASQTPSFSGEPGQSAVVGFP
jgi:hypothetical protein